MAVQKLSKEVLEGDGDTQQLSQTSESSSTESQPEDTNNVSEVDRDQDVHVLVSLEYHGTEYGGWQRQGPNNRINFPSVQGTLEEAATVACEQFFIDSNDLNKSACNDEFRVTLAGNSGRTDKAVHALDHHCVLRLPFPKTMLQSSTSGLLEWLVGPTFAQTNLDPSTAYQSTNTSPFLDEMNRTLPSDIYVKTCRSLTRSERKNLHFSRKRYRYVFQLPPRNCVRPFPKWNDYCYYVGDKLDLDKMQTALQFMVGTHDFLPLSCQKGDVDNLNTVRTIYSAKMNVVEYPFDSVPWFVGACRDSGDIDIGDNRQNVSSCFTIDMNTRPEDYSLAENKGVPLECLRHYKLLSIEFEGEGFLRHQVRRMASVLQKIGMGIWPPECVAKILEGDNETEKATIDHPKLRGQALSPGRGLWLDRVWILGAHQTK